MSAAAFVTPTCADEYFPQRIRAKRIISDIPFPEKLKRDHGFAPLPAKFNVLVTLFNEMEKIFQITHGREQRKTFVEIAEEVKRNTKLKFTEKHLAQIVKIYPSAYTLRWERAKDRRGRAAAIHWELVIHPNLSANADLLPFLDECPALPKAPPPSSLPSSPEKPMSSPIKSHAPSMPCLPPPSPVKLISPIKSHRGNRDYIFRSPVKSLKHSALVYPPIPDTAIKLDPNRRTWRKMIFRHHLVSRVRKTHDKFMLEQKLEFNDEQGVHPKFREKMNVLVADIESDGALPQRPAMGNNNKSGGAAKNFRSTDIREFLHAIKQESRAERDKTPERAHQSSEQHASPPMPSMAKSEPATPKAAANRALKFEPITPKTPLAERLKAKFSANEAARKAGLPDMQRRHAILYRLENSILEVIRSYLNLEQRFSVGLTDRKLLQKLGREVTPVSLLEHLRVLCELLSKDVCWLDALDTTGGTTADREGGGGGPECHYFKISREMGPEWITAALEAIKAEKHNVEQKMRTLHRSPSSCF